MITQLEGLPTRTFKPRTDGLSMIMDKGMSIRQVEDMLDISSHLIDVVKLGFGTSYVAQHVLIDKIRLLHSANIRVYLGGTLFEAYYIRKQLDAYLSFLDKLGVHHIEVSDGSIDIEHSVKCELIHKLSKNYTVLSEVGSKDAKKILAPYQWIKLMKTELEAGAWKVIGEARESGTVGLYRETGEARQGLITEILTEIPRESVLWEAPQKEQQVYFIDLLGPNVNLGNIAPADIIPLETLRLGLRGDTFSLFLQDFQPKNFERS